MGVFEMVVAIVAISVGAGVLKQYLDVKAKQSGAASAELFEKIEQLENRVQTLEELVTDKTQRLRREFDEL